MYVDTRAIDVEFALFSQAIISKRGLHMCLDETSVVSVVVHDALMIWITAMAVDHVYAIG